MVNLLPILENGIGGLLDVLDDLQGHVPLEVLILWKIISSR
jgi:hypothetical protein